MNSEVKVGVFTLLGAVILAGMISFTGALNFGDSGYELTVVYDDAQGLTKGAEVRYAGVHVGTIRQIDVINNHGEVVVEIDKKIRFPKGSVFNVGSDGVMGEKFVNIMPPKTITKEFIAYNARVEGDVGASMDDFLAQSTELLGKVGTIVSNLDQMLTNETIQSSMKEGARNLTQVTRNLKQITAHLEGIVGVIDGVSQEPATAQALRDTIANVHTTSANIRDTSGGVKKMMKTLTEVDVTVDVGSTCKGNDWRSNFGFAFHPSARDFIYAGVYDIGDKNKFDFLVGSKFGQALFSVGAMQGDFGVGLSYDVIRGFRIYSQLYDFDDTKLRVGGEYRLNKNLSVYGETMDARHGTKRETYAGVRAQF